MFEVLLISLLIARIVRIDSFVDFIIDLLFESNVGW